MAKFDLKFLEGNGSHISVNIEDIIRNAHKEDLESRNIIIKGFDADNDSFFQIDLDKSTAIKFAKTLRTEINKIKEVQDGI